MRTATWTRPWPPSRWIGTSTQSSRCATTADPHRLFAHPDAEIMCATSTERTRPP